MDERLTEALERMRADGAPEPARAAFARGFDRLARGDHGAVHGDELEPVAEVPALDELPEPGALPRAVAVRVAGGLATTMGLDGPKVLVEVKPGVRFLDVLLDAGVPTVLMTSWRTDAAIRAAAPQVRTFVQHREPRLRAADLRPADLPGDDAWCPPGHGDVYAALGTSGLLDELLAEGVEVAFLSNADNLGAGLDPGVLGWFAATGAPFAMEVVRGTPADRKGGHVAWRDGRLVLRETAQVPEGDDSFRDVERWRWYNANNLWVHLPALAELLAAGDGAPDLPLIVNRKQVHGTEVLQLETAMGALVGAVEGARLLHVPRTRFAPVKGTDDLVLVRSDAYALSGHGRVVPAFDGDAPPYVELDPDHFKALAALDARMPSGPPSLRACRRFVVHGAVEFGRDVVARGDVEVQGPGRIADGALLEGRVRAA